MFTTLHLLFEEEYTELATAVDEIAERIRVLGNTESANDQPTLDLLTRRMEIHEKNAWMLRSLLE